MRLTIRRWGEGDEDWYVIERAEFDGRRWNGRGIKRSRICGEVSTVHNRYSVDVDGTAVQMLDIADVIKARGFTVDRRCSADIEGTAAQMLDIADAIDARAFTVHKRCSVNATHEPVLLGNPRADNGRKGECSFEEADDLARQIRRLLGGDATEDGSSVVEPIVCAECCGVSCRCLTAAALNETEEWLRCRLGDDGGDYEKQTAAAALLAIQAAREMFPPYRAPSIARHENGEGPKGIAGMQVASVATLSGWRRPRIGRVRIIRVWTIGEVEKDAAVVTRAGKIKDEWIWAWSVELPFHSTYGRRGESGVAVSPEEAQAAADAWLHAWLTSISSDSHEREMCARMADAVAAELRSSFAREVAFGNRAE